MMFSNYNCKTVTVRTDFVNIGQHFGLTELGSLKPLSMHFLFTHVFYVVGLPEDVRSVKGDSGET